MEVLPAALVDEVLRDLGEFEVRRFGRCRCRLFGNDVFVGFVVLELFFVDEILELLVVELIFVAGETTGGLLANFWSLWD